MLERQAHAGTSGDRKAEATPSSFSEVLFLSVAAPENESTTSEIVATVAGKTTPDALVSISGEPVHVDVLG